MQVVRLKGAPKLGRHSEHGEEIDSNQRRGDLARGTNARQNLKACIPGGGSLDARLNIRAAYATSWVKRSS
jgi:hypothetical protein